MLKLKHKKYKQEKQEKQMKRYNKIVEKEIIRILPYHLLGVIFHSIVIYMAFKIPQIIGNILNLLMQETINQEQIIKQT